MKVYSIFISCDNNKYECNCIQTDRQTDRQTDTFIEPICYRFLIETIIIKGKETLTKTLQSLS